MHRYWDYPSPPGEGWPEKLHDLLAGISVLGVEPSLPQEIAVQLHAFNPQVHPLLEQLRLVKSPAEVDMLRQAAHYVCHGMEKILQASYFGVSEIEIFSQSRPVQMNIIKETRFDALNTSLLTAAWPRRLGMQPHGIPSVDDRLAVIWSEMVEDGRCTDEQLEETIVQILKRYGRPYQALAQTLNHSTIIETAPALFSF